MNSMKLKFDLNLERLSSIVVAINVWELPDVKSRTAEYFSTCSPRSCTYSWLGSPEMFDFGKDSSNKITKHDFDKDTWNEITKQAIHYVQLFFIPEKIRNEITNFVTLIGEKMIMWGKYVLQNLKLNSKNLEKIYWNSIGLIDETNIFRFVWKKDKTLYIPDLKEAKCFKLKNSLYSLACLFIQEEFIKGHLEEMKYIIKMHFSQTDRVSDVHSIIKIWMSFYFCGKIKPNNFRSKFEVCSSGELLLKCAKAGLEKAVRYFARHLEKDKEKYLNQAAEETMQTSGDSYINEKIFEITVFLLNEMSEDNKLSFISKYCYRLFALKLNMWPHHELILQLLSIIGNNNKVTLRHSVYNDIICLVLRGITETESRSQYLLKKRKFHQEVLQKLLEILPKDVKIKYISEKKYMLRDVFESSDFSTLALILNDDVIRETKNEIIDFGSEFFKRCAVRCDFDPLNNFLNAAILSNEEVTSFKNKFVTFLETFAKEEKFDAADKLLDFLSSSVEEERVQLKRKVDTIKICEWHHDNTQNFDLSVISKLLIWQFDEDKEAMKEIKQSLRSHNLFTDLFCKIWADFCYLSLKRAKDKCTKFLEWFCEPDEIDTFKKEKLIEQGNFFKIFCDRLHFPKNIKTIDELFKFLSVSAEKVNNFKQGIRDDIDQWIALYGIEKNHFKMAYALVNWISENENGKKTIIENFMSSSKGIELYRKVLHNQRHPFDPVLILLNLWVKPYGNIEKLKENLEKDESHYSINSETGLLHKLKNYGCISPGDLSFFKSWSDNDDDYSDGFDFYDYDDCYSGSDYCYYSGYNSD